MSAITAVVHTRNSAETVSTLLDSLGWVDHMLAVDMASSDGTRELLDQAGAEVVDIPQQRWSDVLRNPWLERVTTPWTLVMDSDEWLAHDAEGLIRGLVEGAPDSVSAFALPRYNYVFGRVVTSARWYPDHQIRLFRTGSLRYHERHHQVPDIVGGGAVEVMSGPGAPHIHHNHYPTIEALIERQVGYALSDDYAHPLEFSAYRQKSLEAMAATHAVSSDDERAAEIVMAWDSTIRALIHWERSGKAVPLPQSLGWEQAVVSARPTTTPMRQRFRAALRRVWRAVFPQTGP